VTQPQKDATSFLTYCLLRRGKGCKRQTLHTMRLLSDGADRELRNLRKPLDGSCMDTLQLRTEMHFDHFAIQLIKEYRNYRPAALAAVSIH
jgi:hypothetical protein